MKMKNVAGSAETGFVLCAVMRCLSRNEHFLFEVNNTDSKNNNNKSSLYDIFISSTTTPSSDTHLWRMLQFHATSEFTEMKEINTDYPGFFMH